MSLLKIAVGHGIQNYTCSSTTAATTATGALAVLYDITNLYPGTPNTGLTFEAFNAISGAVFWGQDIPLNLQTSNAASPGTPSAPNVLSETDYGAVIGDPFPSPSALSLPGVLAKDAPFLGHHFFDAAGIPTFDLSGSGLFGSVNKTGGVHAPSTADSGLLATGAVDWLLLQPNPDGLSVGIKLVYRVITVGGASETCSVLNAASGSVPYSAFYWFFG